MFIWLKKVVSRLHYKVENTRIRLVDERIVVDRANLDSSLSFDWGDIDEIKTFKVDLLTTDDIRLAYRVSGLWHEFSEQDDGFIPLTEAMRARFPAIPEDWYLEVMWPPFATRQRTLWIRSKPTPA